MRGGKHNSGPVRKGLPKEQRVEQSLKGGGLEQCLLGPEATSAFPGPEVDQVEGAMED